MQIRIKKNGCILISGNTNSDDFPVKNAVQSTWKGETDVFLAEIDPLKSGEASLLFSTYIGGTKKEWNSDIVIDPNEKVYLLGGTGSQDFPIENAHPGNSTLNGGTDLFIASLVMNLPSIPKFPISFILWTSISGSVGLLAIVGIVVIFVVRKKRKN